MEMTGEQLIPLSQQRVWEALNNPEILKACIAGCDKLEASGENQYTVGMAVKIGPVGARFAGKIQLNDVNPPESYTLNFEGQGGAAGFGKGQAQVRLEPQGTGCELSYTVRAQVGGKIAQLGQRLIDGVARGMAEDFFKRFDAEMQRLHPEAYAAPAVAGDGAQEAAQEAVLPVAGGMPVWVWGLGAAVLLAVLLLWWMR